jgi:uncharacterized integral membrane protein
MHFLRTIFWVLIAVVVALFAKANWTPVTVKLWGDLVADVKLPLLMGIAFLIGWLPTWLLLRTRIWGHQRRIDAYERNQAATLSGAPVTEADEQVVA